MRSALSRLLTHNLVLPALGVQQNVNSLPTRSKCPLCQSQDTLEITRGYDGSPLYRCSDCGFIGNSVTLLKAYYREPSLKALSFSLIEEGLLDHDKYLTQKLEEHEENERRYQQGPLALWTKASVNAVDQPSSMAGLFQKIGLWSPELLKLTSSFIGFCTGKNVVDHFGDVPPSYKKFFGKKRPLIVIPLWEDYQHINGFWFINHDLESTVLTSGGSIPGNDNLGIGFLPWCKSNSDTTVIVDDIKTAFILIGSCIHNAQHFNIVMSSDFSGNARVPKTRKMIYVNAESTARGYNQCLDFNGCRVLTQREIDRAGGIMNIKLALTESKTVHESIAWELQTLPPVEAMSLVLSLRLHQPDVVQILTAVTPQNRVKVEEMLKPRMVDSSIDFNGTTVSVCEQGWRTDKDGVISNTIIIIDQLVYDEHNDQLTAVGTLCQGDQRFDFATPLKQIERNPHDWLRNELIRQHAEYPQVVTKWRKQLLDLAMVFRKPQTVYTSSAIGWTKDRRRLALPNIYIEDGAISPNPSVKVENGSGTNLTSVDPISGTELKDLTYDDAAGGIFWATFAALSINLFSPFHGRDTFGIAAVDSNETVKSIIDQMVRRVGLKRVTFQSATRSYIREITESEQKVPLPLFVSDMWCKTDAFRKWLEASPTRNSVIVIDKVTALGLSLQSGWLYITTEDTSSDSWMRFDDMWKIIPLFVAWVQKNNVRWPETRSECAERLLHMIQSWLESMGGKADKVITRASRYIKTDTTSVDSLWGGRFLSFLVGLVDQGLLKARSAEDAFDASKITIDVNGNVVFIPLQPVMQVMRDLGIQPPMERFIFSELDNMQALVGRMYRDVEGAVVDRDLYNMYAGLISR